MESNQLGCFGISKRPQVSLRDHLPFLPYILPHSLPSYTPLLPPHLSGSPTGSSWLSQALRRTSRAWPPLSAAPPGGPLSTPQGWGTSFICHLFSRSEATCGRFPPPHQQTLLSASTTFCWEMAGVSPDKGTRGQMLSQPLPTSGAPLPHARPCSRGSH